MARAKKPVKTCVVCWKKFEDSVTINGKIYKSQSKFNDDINKSKCKNESGWKCTKDDCVKRLKESKEKCHPDKEYFCLEDQADHLSPAEKKIQNQKKEMQKNVFKCVCSFTTKHKHSYYRHRSTCKTVKENNENSNTEEVEEFQNQGTQHTLKVYTRLEACSRESEMSFSNDIIIEQPEHIDEVLEPTSQALDNDLEQANPNQTETADLQTVELEEMEHSDEILELASETINIDLEEPNNIEKETADHNENPASVLLPNGNENLIRRTNPTRIMANTSFEL